MATYGMKDAANLTLVNKKTGNIDLFLDYANATSSEWTSERVFATKKGTNAIAWDTNRTGTLTIESEIFDLSYLAMVLGSEIVKGTNGIVKRETVTLDASKQLQLGGNIDENSVSVLKLKEDLIEHDGAPIPATTGALALLPAIPRNVKVNSNDKTAIITFDDSEGAVTYEIKRAGATVGTVTDNSFTDTGLTPATLYAYTVIAVNEFGTSPVSAVVSATTSANGVTTRTLTQATAPAITTAEAGSGTLNAEATNMVTFNMVGNIVQFNDKALAGEHYAVYYTENVDNVRTIEISAKKFPDSYEIFADATIREQESGVDEFVQIHYKKARPQSNFTLTQSATEPTSLSVVFDLFADKNDVLAEMKVVD